MVINKLKVIVLVVILGSILLFALRNLNTSPLPDVSNSENFTENQPTVTLELLTPTQNMKITSPVFNANEKIPDQYTCNGPNTNPPLNFGDIPPAAETLVLIVHDPDAPAGDWIHWLVWNISAKTDGIAEDTVPENAVQGTNDFDKANYDGPCPPSGTHRYVFELYALNSKLELPSTVKLKELEAAMQGKVIAKTDLVGVYSR